MALERRMASSKDKAKTMETNKRALMDRVVELSLRRES
jgi:hypothetical protein